MSQPELKFILETALLAAGRPMSIDNLMDLFSGDDEPPERATVRAVLTELQADWEHRGLELVQVSSGYRFQARPSYATWMRRLWMERPARYSRALLETLSIIAYRQPVTRGEIEEIRGVGVSTSIVKTLTEREWIRVLGHREVPGRPAIYGTTKAFLDHFNLKNLEQLPPLNEVRDLERIHPDLFSEVDTPLPPMTDGDDAALEAADGDEAEVEVVSAAESSEQQDAAPFRPTVLPPDGVTH